MICGKKLGFPWRVGAGPFLHLSTSLIILFLINSTYHFEVVTMFTIHSVRPEGAQKCRTNAVPKAATPSKPNQPRTRHSHCPRHGGLTQFLGKGAPCCFRSRSVTSWPIPRILPTIALVVPIIEETVKLGGYLWGEFPGYHPMIHLSSSPGCERDLGFSLRGSLGEFSVVFGAWETLQP